MTIIPNSLALVGSAHITVNLALKRILKLDDTKRPLLVIDYSGYGLLFLSKRNLKIIQKHFFMRLDIADRSCPISLFQLKNSQYYREILFRFLSRLKQILRLNVSDSTLNFIVDVGYQLSKKGNTGLMSFFKTLSNENMNFWFQDKKIESDQILRFLNCLSWIMHFPIVFALSESNNQISLVDHFEKDAITWIEMKMEHFEAFEYLLSVLLIETAVEDSLRAFFEKSTGLSKNSGPSIVVIHLFPPHNFTNHVPEWILATSPFVRHVAVLKMRKYKRLGNYELDWIRRASSIWVHGSVLTNSVTGADAWLDSDELETLKSVDSCGVLVKSNTSGKFFTTRVSRPEIDTDYVQQLKTSNRLKCQRTPISQLSTAIERSHKIFFGSNNNLYQKLCDYNTLQSGWFKVQEGKKASHGVDGITLSMFDKNLDKELQNLSDELLTKRYKCRPLKRVYIPKSDGSLRAIGIACVRDRVVQSSCLNLLEPIFDPLFSHFSFGYRPRRSAHHAISMARSMLSSKKTWIVCADIRKCFDCLDHDLLLDLVSNQINDNDLLNLIRQWLIIDVFEFGDFNPSDIGVPQGASLSPLLANIYLDPIDKHFEKKNLSFIRYADDISIFTANEAEAIDALKILGDFLHNPLKLELKPGKTNYVSIETGFDFLGFRLDSKGIEVQQKKIESVLQLMEPMLHKLSDASSSLEQKIFAFTRINAIVRGFRNYFLLPGEKRIFKQMIALDGRLEQLALSILPTIIRDDPAWLGREKFSLLLTDQISELETAAQSQLNTLTGEYSKMTARYTASGWAVNTKENETRDLPSKDTLLISDGNPDDEDIDDRPGSNSIVKHVDRLYVLTHGSYLTIENDFIVVKKRKKEIFRCSINEIGLLFLQGIAMNVAVNLQIRCAELDVPIVIAPPYGEPLAALNPIRTAKSHIRSLQVLRREDTDMIKCGLSMLAAKVGNQASVIKYFAKYRKRNEPDFSQVLNKTADDLRVVSQQIESILPDKDDVRAIAMGYEGYAATIYWKAFSSLIPSDFSFNGRITLHAGDHINQCLNYVYGILYGEIWRAIVKNGLDPYFGLIHGSKRNQGSLVFDIIEEYRAPFADRLVLAMLGRGFQPEIGDHGLLRTKSKRLLAQAFSRQWSKKTRWRSLSLTPARILQSQIMSLIKQFSREDNYRPFKMRW